MFTGQSFQCGENMRTAIYIYAYLKILKCLFLADADPGPQDPVLGLQYTNTYELQKSCGEKGTAWPLSK